jgi:hypothetical protein
VPKPQGRILRGRIVEAGTGRPVADASVVYQPGPGNPHNHDEYEFRNPVLTDGEGNFALSILPGKGLLAVEAPTPDFICVPLTGQSSAGSSIGDCPHGFARLDLPRERTRVTRPCRLLCAEGSGSKLASSRQMGVQSSRWL